MDLHRLEVFCAVYEEESFSRGARRLRLSQPTVSAHLAALEEEIAAPLFDRLGREIVPTPTAQLLYRHARALLERRRRMVDELARHLHRLEGEVVAGASTIPGEYLLPPLLGRFHAAHPGIRVRLLIHDSRQVTARVQAGQLELGFVGGRFPDGDLEFRELARDHLVLAAASDSPWLTATTEATLDELAAYPFLLREPGSGTRLALEQALQRLGSDLSSLRVVAELGSTAAIKEAVKAGVGVSVLSAVALRSELAAGLVRVAELAGADGFARSFFAVRHRRRAATPLAEALLDFLAGQLQPVAE